jgi:RNA polymerase sigma-70 factor (ECF subfamily)
VTAFRKLETFRGDAAFRTWLLRIAWREAQDRRRSLRRRLRRFVAGEREDSLGDTVPGSCPSPEDALAGAELRDQIRRLVRALPARLREPLLLAATREHTYEEMALILDAPAGTVKWRVAEARKQLKDRLARLGYRHA